MNYKNTICDGCGVAFGEDDDIVVCPDCGTPQHRSCYNKNGRCVNKDKHNEGFEWQGSSSAHTEDASSSKADDEKIPCPSCGHMNSKDAVRCENCSMRLIVFGMNLAQEIAKEKSESEALPDDVPDYPPPFELGKGEGFEYADEAKESDAPVQQASEQTKNNAFVNAARAKTAFLYRFVAQNQQKYISVFNEMDCGKRFHFNWAAFFFAPYWFFFRKLHKAGIIFLTALVLLSIVFAPLSIELSELTDYYYSNISTLAENQEALDAFMLQFSEIMPQTAIMLVSELILRTAAGFVAYPLYKKHTDLSAKKIACASSPQNGMLLMSRLGGVSYSFVLFSFAAQYLINYLVSYILFG